MEYYLLYTLVVVAAMSRHVTIVDSCRCLLPNPYQAICTSNVAVNATVVSTSFPRGVPESRNEEYPVRYQLDIHNVFNSPGGIDTVPDVVISFLPGNLCGLNLADDTTYILAGNLTDDPENPGDKVIGMMLCDLNMNINGRQPYQMPVDDIIDWLDCSNPPYYVSPEPEGASLKRNEQENGQRDNGKMDALRELGLVAKRREMADGLESFLSAFTWNRKRGNRMPPLP